MKRHYLIVWGNMTKHVRFGLGDSPREACIYAYGMYQPSKMTTLYVAAYLVKSRSQRTKFIAETLLPEHMKRHPEFKESATKEINELVRTYKVTWDASAKISASKKRK